ncbi:MAG TPA: OmpA family protein [Stellaceae bacterium]|nr:OmpA family protein [Stellaceae bacterium]
MKNPVGTFIGAVALAALLPCAAFAQTDDGWVVSDGPYVGAAGGGNFPFDSNFGPSSTTGGTSGRVTFDDDWAVAGEAGYGWGNGLRTELEVGFNNAGVGGVKFSGPPTGRRQEWDFFGNVLYDFDLGLPISPHVGAGIGLANTSLNHVGWFGTNYVAGNQNVFAYQGIAGVDYAVTPNIKLGLDYRFVGSEEGQYGVVPGGGTVKTALQTNLVLLGLRYEFNQPPAPPVAAPPPPPPPPAPPPVPKVEAQRSFQVFFDFDKSNITDAAMRVIQSAADAVKAGNTVQITVTGHTDTVGTAAYNQGLSERRAAAVKTQLVTDGVSASEITTVGVGKNGLLVPTADGVREPQNRRAEIVLQ